MILDSKWLLVFLFAMSLTLTCHNNHSIWFHKFSFFSAEPTANYFFLDELTIGIVWCQPRGLSRILDPIPANLCFVLIYFRAVSDITRSVWCSRSSVAFHWHTHTRVVVLLTRDFDFTHNSSCLRGPLFYSISLTWRCYILPNKVRKDK